MLLCCCFGAALVLLWCCSGAALALLWFCSGTGAALALLWRCSGATPNLRTPDRRLSMSAGLQHPSALRLSLRPRTPKLQCCQTTLSSPQNIKFVRVGGTHGWHSLLGPTNQIPELASPAPAAPNLNVVMGPLLAASVNHTQLLVSQH